MAADIKLEDLTKVLNDKLKKIEQDLSVPTYMNELANKLKNDIENRTKLGYGVDIHGGEQSKFKPLAKSTIEARSKKKLDGTTSPAKSNLTETGAMLRDLSVSVSNNNLSISLKSQESKDKAIWAVGHGRSFLNISKSQIIAITEIIKKKVIELLK